jgi:hypothetical protein
LLGMQTQSIQKVGLKKIPSHNKERGLEPLLDIYIIILCTEYCCLTSLSKVVRSGAAAFK